MDKKTQNKLKSKPHYVKIYRDLVRMKYPQHWEDVKELLEKDELSYFEIERLNKKLFQTNSPNKEQLQQKYKAYDEKTITQILLYQKKNNLNNLQLAKHFKLSRNTVAKWRKIFYHEIVETCEIQT